MEEHQLLRLRRVEVDGLFGVYDHRIDLDLDTRVTLLHGRNGVGKTTILRMISALMRGEITYFSRIPFTRFLLTFQGGANLELKPIESGDGKKNGILTLIAEGKKESDNVELRSGEAEFLETRTEDHLEPYYDSENSWIDIRNGAVLTESEALDRYNRWYRAPQPAEHHEKQISWLDEFLKGANAHLIEAERLVRRSLYANSGASSDPAYYYQGYQNPRYPVLASSVVKRSRALKERLDLTMRLYGLKAQLLDQTFPQRLMTDLDRFTLDEVRTRMIALTSKTDSYTEIGILNKAPAPPFSIENLKDLNDVQARVIALYVQDTEEKLKILEHLASRTNHLLGSLNKKLRHKKIRFDREEGLIAQGKENQKLPLHSLSSGEQHELVLHYDLLFNTRPNTVVLIDEPEISLHVAWQKNFLSDLIEIVKISGFDAIVATHSPYIVGDREDLMVGLDDPN